jgi:hypothetical protein
MYVKTIITVHRTTVLFMFADFRLIFNGANFSTHHSVGETMLIP